MGGAFISIAIHDPSQNRIVTIEGNVYAPNFSKRIDKEMESIICSYEFCSSIKMFFLIDKFFDH